VLVDRSQMIVACGTRCTPGSYRGHVTPNLLLRMECLLGILTAVSSAVCMIMD